MSACRVPHAQAKYAGHHLIDRNLWDSQPNVLIDGICQNGRTELAACPVVGLVGESLPTATAYVSLKMIADNPPLDPAIEKFQVVNGFLVILMTKNGFGATVRTLLGLFGRGRFVSPVFLNAFRNSEFDLT